MATLAVQPSERDAPAPGPVLPGERILALDVIRGFAMFGVLVAYCVWSLGTLPESAFTRLDHFLAAAVTFAIDGKFYTLLAFLFGLGFQLQLGRAREGEGDAVRLYRRRLLVLAGIGLAHALLLRNGDILLPYALTGLLLIPFRNASDRTLLGAAFLILLVPAVVHALWEATGVPIPDRPDDAGTSYLAENFAWVRYWYATAILNWPPNLTLFLVGFWAGRHQLVTRIADRPGLARRVLAAGLFAGIGFFLARIQVDRLPEAWSVLRRLAADLSFTFHAWGLAAAYVSLLLLALRSRAGERALRPLAAVGRMALTNYLAQATLIVPVCLMFGLFDRFTPSTGLALALALFALQVPFSVLWLKRFPFGPAERIWRVATYGRLAASRKTAAPDTVL